MAQTPVWGESEEPKAHGPQLGPSIRFQQDKGEIHQKQEGEKLGNIYDLVINSRGQILFVVLSHGGFLGPGRKVSCRPISVALSFDQKGKEVVLNVHERKAELCARIQKERPLQPAMD